MSDGKYLYILRKMYNVFQFIFPKNRYGDYLVSFALFVVSHRRIPRNKKLLSDYLFFLKVKNDESLLLRQFITDKEYFKIYVKGVCGDEYVIPTIKILKNKKEINEYEFPERCCIKPTHASGRVILKTDNNVDREVIMSWLNIRYYKNGREKNYKNLQPKIIVEPLIFDSTNVEDYKFFCYKGKVGFIQIDLDRYIDHTRLYYDAEWNELEFSINYKRSLKRLPKPENIKEMISIAEKLSSKLEFIRVDLYTDGERIIVGELTNYPGNCNERFVPVEAENIASNILFK